MNINASTEARLVALVRQVATKEILPRFMALAPNEIETKTHADDLVTVADREAERCLTQGIQDIIPHAVVIGEEAVSAGAALLSDVADAEVCVLVDPVDGTWNFANGLPLFGVMLAVVAQGHTLWGLIYDPMSDDYVVAQRNEGARHVSKNGVETQLNFGKSRIVASKATGYVHATSFTGSERSKVFDCIPTFAKADSLRCSAHEYRLLARNVVDFVVSPILTPWDHAAGCLVAQECGGIARFTSGINYTPTQHEGRLIVAKSENDWHQISDIFDLR
ncbi:MAG: inositol monophosphatase [Boseongicola sp.]|nr:MAG: inositol monophosphatase [Boseongicola sp.]